MSKFNIDIPQGKATEPKERTFVGEHDKSGYSTYDECIDSAKRARNTQYKDTDPMIEKEGFLGVDDLDKMRRRQIR